jgi:hypothetical protein
MEHGYNRVPRGVQSQIRCRHGHGPNIRRGSVVILDVLVSVLVCLVCVYIL